MTVVDPSQSQKKMDEFINNLKDKIRDNISNMLPDEVLANLAQQVIKDSFFSDIIIKDRYGNVQSKERPVFVQLVLENSEKIIKQHVDRYCKEQENFIQEKIIEILKNGLPNLLQIALQNMVIDTISKNQYTIVEAIRSQLGR